MRLGAIEQPPQLSTRLLLAFLIAGSLSSGGYASERDDAVQFLKTTLECPLRVESSNRKDGWFYVKKTSNAYRGGMKVFKLRESYTETSGKIGGESYETDHFIDVSFSFSEVAAVSVNGSKATVKCSGNRACMTVLYVDNPDEELQEVAMRRDPMNCFEEGMCRVETTRRKASYRISTCDAEAASDIREAIEFLSSQR